MSAPTWPLAHSREGADQTGSDLLDAILRGLLSAQATWMGLLTTWVTSGGNAGALVVTSGSAAMKRIDDLAELNARMNACLSLLRELVDRRKG